MGEKPVDLAAVRRAEAKLKKLLKEYPELRECNPERQAALEAWLEDNLQEDTDNAKTKDW
jgi:hypothetical protein